MKTARLLIIAAVINMACSGAAFARVVDKDSELVNAVLTGNLDSVEKHLRRGAFINAKSPDSKPVLLIAIENDRPDIAEVLIAKGANVNFADPGGNTPLMIAAKKGQEGMVKLLLSKGANPNTQQSNIKSVYASDNRTPIMFAAEGGNPGIVKMLIAKGANINKKGRDGKTALKIAEEKDFSDIVDILKKAGAK